MQDKEEALKTSSRGELAIKTVGGVGGQVGLVWSGANGVEEGSNYHEHSHNYHDSLQWERREDTKH